MPSRLDVVDPTFPQDLKESEPAVFIVEEYLVRRDFPVYRPPTKCREDSKDWRENSDGADLWILSKETGDNESRVEVKHLKKIDFRHGQFPLASVIVDNKRRFDAKVPVPAVYYLLNKSMSVAIVVDVAKTKHLWTVGETRNRQMEYECYRCPISAVYWRAMPREGLVARFEEPGDNG